MLLISSFNPLLQVNLGNSRHEASFAQSELARERQKNQAIIESMRSKLEARDVEFKKAMDCHKQKLEITENNAQKAQQQSMLMKLKVILRNLVLTCILKCVYM